MNCSIYQVNINSYDEVFPNRSVNTNNILFTDNVVADGWSKYEMKDLDKVHPFNDVFRVRWNPFDYSNSDYIIWVDGSIEVIADPSVLINEMEKSHADFAILKHPWRNNIFDEYREWCRIRNYNQEQAFKWLVYMYNHGWDAKQPGLYQSTIMIFRNSDKCKAFCKAVYEELFTFSKDKIERLDQTVASFIIKTKFMN